MYANTERERKTERLYALFDYGQRKRMTRAERRREAAEGRLRVLLLGASPLYAAVASSVAAKHESERVRRSAWRSHFTVGVGLVGHL